MANSSSLKFVVEVQADQADRALKALTTSFNEANVAFRAQAQTMGAAAKGAGAEVISLGDRIKQVAREQRQEARAASFYVQELAAIAPVSATAKLALGGLIEAMVGGAGIGAAIAITTTAIRLMTSAWAEEEKAAKAAQDARDKHVESINKDVEGNRRRGFTPGENTAQDVGYTRMRLSDAATQAAALRSAIEAEKQSMGADWFKINQWQRDLDELERDIESMKAALRELDAKLRTEIEAADRENAGREAAKPSRALKTDLESYTAGTGGFYKTEASKPRVGIGALIQPDDDIKYIYNASKAQKDYNDELKKTTALYEQWGNQLADIGIALATNQMTAQQAIQVIGRMLLQQIASYLVTKAAAALAEHTLERTKNVAIVTEQAGVAGASAAAQVASTPAFMAAPAVGAAIAAAVLGEMLPLAAASRGWDVPGGGPFPALLHKREMVLPEKYADVIRKGGGGGDTFYVQAMDPRSFARVLDDRNSEVARAERKRLRRRRA